MFSNHFYHETLRNTVVAFGTLFNDITIIKKNSDGSERTQIQVPLAYAAREKFIQRLKEDSRLNDDTNPNPHVQMTLPRLSFNMVSMSYDSGRKRNTIHRKKIKDIEGSQDHLSYQYAEVPYNIGFELGVYATTFEDGLQIVEQIVPYFTPEFNLTFQRAGGTSDINTKVDLPIILESVNLEQEYLGDFESRRLLIWTLSFTVKTNLYGPVRREKTILDSSVTLFNLDGLGLTSGQIVGHTGGDEYRSLTGNTYYGASSRIDLGVTGGTGIYIDGSQETPNADPPYTSAKIKYQFDDPDGGDDVIDTTGATI